MMEIYMKKLLCMCLVLLVVLIAIAPLQTIAQEDRTIQIEPSNEVIVDEDESHILPLPLYVGKNLSLSATTQQVNDVTEPVKTIVTWFSSDPAIAKVDTKGVVTGVSPGHATITAQAKDDENIMNSVLVEVRRPVKSFKLVDTKLSLLVGAAEESAQAAIQYTLVPEDAYDQTVQWASSDENVAVVDQSGLVTAISVGKANITAKPNDPSITKAVSCAVTASQAASSIDLSHTKETIYTAASLKLKAVIHPDNVGSKKVVWTTSDKAIATVDSAGTVTAKKPGNVVITCTAADGSGVYSTCDVTVIQKVKTVTVTPKSVTLLLGGPADAQSAQLDFTIKPELAHYQDVVWSSSNEAVAIVNEQGLVQAVSPGKTTITAVSTDPGITAKNSSTIVVGNAVKAISLSASNATVDKGKTLKLTASITPEDVLSKKISWTSSNTKVATVSTAGVVSAKGVGKATITATATDGSGVSKTVDILVVQKVTSLSSSSRRIILFEGSSSKGVVKVSPADASNKAIKWSSDSNYVAAVDQNGVITAKRAGEATITAIAADGSNKKTSIKVIVEPANPISLDSIGFGRYLPNLLALTVSNKTRTVAFTDFDFKMELYSYNGTMIDSGSYSLGNPVRMGAGSTKTIKRTVFGVGMATKVVITITGVKLSDGSFYSIPRSLQETWTFRR